MDRNTLGPTLSLGLALMTLTACVEPSATQSPSWTVKCTGDAVSNRQRCFAGTFGAPMGYDGQPYLPPSIPFQIVYEGGRGPFVVVGYHNFPGEKPTVRFDSDKQPFVVPDDGGVTRASPAPSIVNRMLNASVARARYRSWPDAPSDIYVDMTGFAAAWGELQSLLTK